MQKYVLPNHQQILGGFCKNQLACEACRKTRQNINPGVPPYPPLGTTLTILEFYSIWFDWAITGPQCGSKTNSAWKCDNFLSISWKLTRAGWSNCVWAEILLQPVVQRSEIGWGCLVRLGGSWFRILALADRGRCISWLFSSGCGWLGLNPSHDQWKQKLGFKQKQTKW